MQQYLATIRQRKSNIGNLFTPKGIFFIGRFILSRGGSLNFGKKRLNGFGAFIVGILVATELRQSGQVGREALGPFGRVKGGEGGGECGDVSQNFGGGVVDGGGGEGLVEELEEVWWGFEVDHGYSYNVPLVGGG